MAGKCVALPLVCGVLSVETSGRSPPQCGTGQAIPTEKKYVSKGCRIKGY